MATTTRNNTDATTTALEARLVVAYLLAIVIANLSVAAFGLQVVVLNSLILISLDLTSRDALHDLWRGRVWRNMTLLILAGGALSFAFNTSALGVAVASSVAWLATGFTDVLVYQLLGDRARLVRMNGSNLVSAAVDTVVFVSLAAWLMGFTFDPVILLQVYAVKIIGGFFWSLLLQRISNGR